ncbi:hypothetical protein C8F04DRAFT_1261874 [Mycena alexandri]|uniref:Uncharacterized protein n=1 Tax=Mycena alexandri TaxID=1745969 RepID=A0AAD6SRV6_9AGAR|nr:hypothetical protein C8F04DRAFT_1261874 [Mycena alexandri]
MHRRRGHHVQPKSFSPFDVRLPQDVLQPNINDLDRTNTKCVGGVAPCARLKSFSPFDVQLPQDVLQPNINDLDRTNTKCVGGVAPYARLPSI